MSMRDVKWAWRGLRMAEMVAGWSKDPSTKCGAVILRPDNTVASVGYNGFPRGCNDDPVLYADRELKLARVVHAEVNAILSAREPLHGYTMATWPPGYGPSCERCTTCIIQTGITRIIHVTDDSNFASRWRESAERGLDMYREAGIEVVGLPMESGANFV